MAKMRTNPKKSFPGSFLLFIAAAIFIIIGVQTLSSGAAGKVSFSHQAEHLTNLSLVVPEDNRKVAQNDNLVTFSGRFREQLADESSNKYHYLDLLNLHHELSSAHERLSSNLDLLQKNVRDSADLFLHVSGQTIPPSGYVVVGPLYDSPERNSAIVLHSLTDREVVSLPFVQRSLALAQSKQTVETISALGTETRDLVALLRSPALGIGSESLKRELKNLSGTLDEAIEYSPELQLRTYRNSLNQLTALIGNLGREIEGVRLSSLRSVRSYVEDLQEYNQVSLKLLSNTTLLDKARSKVSSEIWFFNNKEVSTRTLEKQDPEVFGHWFSQAKEEWAQFDGNKGLNYRAPDQPRNTVLEKKFKSEEPSPNYFSYVLTLLPVMLIMLFLYFIFSRQMKGAGSGAMNFGKSPAKLMTKDTNKTTFKDVAGAEEAKEELTEIVDFLKDPSRFTALGARIPKGVLLVGPPGTGKTLVAKAVAGEADRPFFSISGSDFVEMFVGVGASRIRDMFETAKKSAPCIIFMDEIDAVGRHRGAGVGGGHDEREQTLNQLLVEMDGFDTREGVILMAATNRPDVLDRALLRPGRFDRRVTLDLPDVKGRHDILKVHARKIKMDKSVNLGNVAKITPGASGADLENILNEAALLAARRGRSAVTGSEVIEATDKVRYGKERRSLEMDNQEKLTTAFHESGHAIAGLVVKHSDPVDKVTIIPRGFSLGATHFMPTKNRLSYWKKEVLDKLVVLMGGRAAEELFVKDMSSGAQHDIMQATKIARSMVCEWGMSKDLGTVTYDERSEQGQYLGMSGHQEKNYSNETAQAIDKEVRELIDAAHIRAVEILKENKDKVQLMTDMLMEFETLDKEDLEKIMAGTWDSEEKKERIKSQDDLQMNTPPAPPPVPDQAACPSIDPQTEPEPGPQSAS